jgi:hypothetical protein
LGGLQLALAGSFAFGRFALGCFTGSFQVGLLLRVESARIGQGPFQAWARRACTKP